MSAKKVVAERRDPDQDAAVEAAFVAAVLPEEDRRHEEEGVPPVVDEVIEEVAAPTDTDVLASAGIGSVFEKVAHGWKVTYVDGGTRIFLDGPSLGEAFVSHGMQVKHT